MKKAIILINLLINSIFAVSISGPKHLIEELENHDSISSEELAILKKSKIVQSNDYSISDTLVSIRTFENFYFDKIGGGLRSFKHGEERSFPLPYASIEMSKANFRNKAEKISLEAGFADPGFVSITWLKMLSLRQLLQIQQENGWFTSQTDGFTNSFYSHSKISYTHFITTSLYLFTELRGSHNRYTFVDSTPFTIENELRHIIGLVVDTRDDELNPRRGLYSHIKLSYNNLAYLYNPNTQIEPNLSIYIPFKERVNGLAYNIQSIVTVSGSFNRFHKLLMGGYETVRGFSIGSFGTEETYNNIVTSTLEYRHHFFRIKSIKLPFLSWYDENLKDFPVEVDGALFTESGILTKELSISDYEYAFSTGLGIRLIFPTVDISGCIDVGMPLKSSKDFDPKPLLHLYVNLPF